MHLSLLQGKAFDIETAGTMGDVGGLFAVGAVQGPGGFGAKDGTGTGLALALA